MARSRNKREGRENKALNQNRDVRASRSRRSKGKLGNRGLAYQAYRERREYEYKIRRERLKRNGFDSYQDYIKSDKWEKRRARYYKKYPKDCKVCSTSSTNIILHHLSYFTVCKEPDKDLVPLCGRCHTLAHLYGGHHSRTILRRLEALFKIGGVELLEETYTIFKEKKPSRKRHPVKKMNVEDLTPEQREKYGFSGLDTA